MIYGPGWSLVAADDDAFYRLRASLAPRPAVLVDIRTGRPVWPSGGVAGGTAPDWLRYDPRPGAWMPGPGGVCREVCPYCDAPVVPRVARSVAWVKHRAGGNCVAMARGRPVLMPAANPVSAYGRRLGMSGLLYA